MRKSVATGLASLIGKRVLIFCMNYIYEGKLASVSQTCAELEGASIVYETGPFYETGYRDAQPLPGGRWWIEIAAIESFGAGK